METTLKEEKLSRSEDVQPGKRLVIACDGKNDSPFLIYFSLFNRNNEFIRYMDGMPAIPHWTFR